MASLLACFIKEDYPKNWPTIFNDLMSFFVHGREAVDLFLRTIKALDEDFISLESSMDRELGAKIMFTVFCFFFFGIFYL